MGCGKSKIAAEVVPEEGENKKVEPEQAPKEAADEAQNDKSEKGNNTIAESQSKKAMEAHSKHHLSENLAHEEVNRNVFQVYESLDDQILGTGVTGAVRVLKHKITGQPYALKTLHLNKIKNKQKIAEIKNEVKIMTELDHPNIIRLQEYFVTDDHIYLVMELCTGGELLTRLNAQRGHHYSEMTAVRIMRQMLAAVRYLHDRGIAHRDLKLENFIFEHDRDDSPIKLIDFGLSRHYRGSEYMHMPVGTPFYVAPEVLDGCYTQECDMWSLGVIAYMLVSGRPPFYGKDEQDTLRKVREGAYRFPSKVEEQISDHAKDFVKKMMEMDPNKRLTAKEAQAHPWMHDFDDEDDVRRQPLNVEVLNNLASFGKLSMLKKIAHEVVAFTMRPDQIDSLRNEFLKFDKEECGEITLQHFKAALQASNHLTDEQVESIFQSSDLDHTGKIHWVEFLAASMSESTLDEKHLEEAFERIDFEHKGYIAIEDLRALVGVDVDSKDLEKVFDPSSKEGEGLALETPGRITLDEFKAYMKGGATVGANAGVQDYRRRFLEYSKSLWHTLSAPRSGLPHLHTNSGGVGRGGTTGNPITDSNRSGAHAALMRKEKEA